MNPETDQQDPESTTSKAADLVSMSPEPTAPETLGPVSLATAKTAKRRAGVPVWRTGKPDAFLAAAVDTARTAIEGITAASEIGPHIAAKSEEDRLVTHLFECRLPGYGGWQWFAVLTRNSRSKVVTVNELGLLPSEDSILAPEWVPWAERVRPGDEQDLEPETGQQDTGVPEGGMPEAVAHDDGAHEAQAPEAAATEPDDGDTAALEAVDVDAAGPDDDALEDEAQDAAAGGAPELYLRHDAGTH